MYHINRRDFDTLKKFKKLKKYQVKEFKEEHNFNLVDEFVMSFSPNKRQFDFLKEVMLKKEYELKSRYQEGIKKLIKAKDILGRTSVDLYAYITFMMRSQVIKTKQIIESKITGICPILPLSLL